MAAGTERQRKQQVLAWKLRCVVGARANLYPREKKLSPALRDKLLSLVHKLQELEQDIRTELRNIK